MDHKKTGKQKKLYPLLFQTLDKFSRVNKFKLRRVIRGVIESLAHSRKRRCAMTETKDKGELVVKRETHPEAVFGDMERYIENFFRHPFSLMTPSLLWRDFAKVGEITPTVDIFEEGNELVLKADLPGIDKKDLDVTITENKITISGEKKQEDKVERKDYHWIERSYGTFTRSFQLPRNVNGEKAKATFKEGVLEIRLPKTGESREKKIDVK